MEQIQTLAEFMGAVARSKADPYALRDIAEARIRMQETDDPNVHPLGDFIAGEDILKPIPPVKWFCEPLGLCPGAVTIIGAPMYLGKSTLAMGLTLSGVSGKPFLGRFPVRQGPAVWVDYDADRFVTRRNFARLARSMGLSKGDLDGLYLFPAPKLYLDERGAERRLLREIRMCGAVLATFDAFRGACPDVEENSSQARRPLDMLKRVSEETECLMNVIHHAKKPGQAPDAGLSRASILRGSSALADAADTILVLSKEGEEPTYVTCEKARTKGRRFDPFYFEIEGDAANLRLKYVEGAAKDQERAELAQRDVESRILAILQEYPGGLNQRQILTELGGNKQKMSAVLKGMPERYPNVTVRVNGTSATAPKVYVVGG